MPAAYRRLFPTRAVWLPYAIFTIVLAWACFGNLRTHLLDTHDGDSFRDNLEIQRQWTHFFSSEKSLAPGRPVAEAAKYIAFLVWGNSPAAFHLLAVGFHTFAALLLARVVRLFGSSLELAGGTGLLFLVNVAHFEAVYWISALDYPLALCLGLVSLLNLRRPAAFAACLFLGVLSHAAIAATWALSLYLLGNRASWGEHLRLLVPSGLLSCVAFSVSIILSAENTSTLSSIDLYGSQPLPELILGVMRVLVWFTGRLFTTAHWLPVSIYIRQPWELYLGTAICVLLLCSIWRRRQPLALGAVATLLGLLPFSLLTEATILGLPAGPSRYLYFASAGSSLLLAWCCYWLAQRVSSAETSCSTRALSIRRLAFAALLAGVIVSSFVSLRKVEAISFYTSGRHYIANGETGNGISQMRRAIAQDRQLIPLADAYQRLSLTLLARTPELAQATIDSGLAENPKDRALNIYKLILKSANSESTDGRNALATLTSLGKSMKNREIIARGYYSLGEGLGRRGNTSEAERMYRRALSHAPNKPHILKALGRVLFQQNRLAEAVGPLEQLTRLDSTNYKTRYILGRLYAMQKDSLRARAAFNAVTRIAPQSAEASKARQALADQ